MRGKGEEGAGALEGEGGRGEERGEKWDGQDALQNSSSPQNEDYYKSTVWGMNVPLRKQEEEVSLVMVLAVSQLSLPARSWLAG